MIKQFAREYLTELTEVIQGVPLDNFEVILNTLYDAYVHGHSVFIMGNGGSASTASHFACDINKGVCSDTERRFRVICLCDNIPTMLAYANDKSYDDIFIEQLINLLKPDDVAIGISGSGNSKNVIKALQYANDKDATSVAFTGFDGGQLARIAKVSIIVPTDDMQKVEDVHLILTHIIMQFFYKKLMENNYE